MTISNEEQLQAACYQWFWNTYPNHRQMLFHVQQSAWNRIQGSRFKAIGVTKGVSDLIFVGLGFCLFIELKMPASPGKPAGKQSTEQKDFEHKVKTRGHKYIVCYTVEQFKKIMQYVITLRING